MTTLQVLREARELIADRDRWCSGDFALDGDGVIADPEDDAACRRCAVGAVRFAVRDDPESRYGVIFALLDAMGPDKCALTDFNDRRGHAAVIDLFDRAITNEEER